MRALWKPTLLLVVALTCPLTAAAPPLSLSQYVAELKQLRQTATGAADPKAISSLAQELPAQWSVAADGREFEVPTNGLKHWLTDYLKQPTPANRDAITSQLDLLLGNAQAMQSPQVTLSGERSRLAEILSRREFRKVEGETWYDRLKRAVQRWLWGLVQRMLLSSAYPAISKVLIWGLLAAAIAVAGYWVVRSYRAGNIYTQFSGAPDVVSAKPWRDWQAEAQVAAQRGRWRDAVHLLYWAGISFLEAQGLWRPDLARTPREYLRLLPVEDVHRSPLQQLTRTFEAVWYGNDPATAQTFAGASALLEQLGCR